MFVELPRANHLLRKTTHGMPTCVAPDTPDWLPATRTQLQTGNPAYSAPARSAATILARLDRPINKLMKIDIIFNYTANIQISH